MSLRSYVEQYLAMRRSLGFKLRGEGRMLLEFADRLDRAGQATITVAAALAWASEPSDSTAAHRQRRLAVVRGLACYLAAFDPHCQIPPPGLLPGRAHRPTPYHYSRGDRGVGARGRHDRRAADSGHDAGVDQSDRGQRPAAG